MLILGPGGPRIARARQKNRETKDHRVSARIGSVFVLGILLLAATQGFEKSAAQTAGPAAPPSAAPAQAKPVDEAAIAAQESEEALSRGDGVVAKVNDTPISNYDVRQRVALFVSTSGTRPTPEQITQIRGQVLKQLETERLELLEAEKDKVTVSAADVDKAINDILKDNHLTMEQLNKVLSESNVRTETLRAQIAAQIAWSKLVQDQLGDRVHVSTLDVDDELARLKRGANKSHYVVAEIFQAVDTPEQEAKVKKDMESLETQLQAGAPFSSVARQFSQNPTAAQGGDLGVIQEGQLPPELDKVLVTMRPGQYSPPVRATGGYYILFLRELLAPEGANLANLAPAAPSGPPGTLPLFRILLPLGPKPAANILQNVMKIANVMRSQIQNCTGAREVAKRLPGAQQQDLGNMRLADLSEQMQSEIGQTEAGGSTVPFQSPAGIEIIVRCDKAVPKIGNYKIPTHDQVEEQIYEEQITTLARQYLRDLRRDADIETVGKS
jgi:peptidyl-prolyl cis-trans isomerase SurA